MTNKELQQLLTEIRKNFANFELGEHDQASLQIAIRQAITTFNMKKGK
nr:MAG TPA: hypothetical protein [Caudoviricetes sp.]